VSENNEEVTDGGANGEQKGIIGSIELGVLANAMRKSKMSTKSRGYRGN
jgi:hypothetical protein